MQMKWDQPLCIYLLYLVGVTIFTNKSANYVDEPYLKYFKDLELVFDFSWGKATLAHLYMEHNSGVHYKLKQIVGYLTLLQV
jgi:hypothetical protein